MRIFSFILFVLFLFSDFLSVANKKGEVFFSHSAQQKIAILYDANDESTIKIAVYALAADIELITGVKPNIETSLDSVTGNAIIVGSIDKSKFIRDIGKRSKINCSLLKSKWENFHIKPVDKPFENINHAIVVAGSDKRGAAYGVFYLSESIGISPWNWWADVHPKVSDKIYFQRIDYESKTPTVKYRGIFLNDECWGLNPWASRTFETEEGNIGPKTYARIFELLLRLKGNFIWPAMHPCTNAFYKNPENPKTANRYGIVVGTSHAEPMLRNNVDEWDKKSMGDFNFFTNHENVLRYWDQRVFESQHYESIYTLGMRGIHDSGMEGAENMEQQLDALSEIIKQQRMLIEKHINANVDSVPQAFTAYKEVLDIYDAGLVLPDDITVVWPDDNYGYIHRFSDAQSQDGNGGSGVYYHLSYWGRPHDYLWLSSTHPALIWSEMAKASYFGSNKIWVANVGDIKPLEYNISLFLDMAWDNTNFKQAKSVREHFDSWFQKIFGSETGAEIARLTWEYYDLNFQRRPEFMGWSQTEPTRKTHYSEFNHFEAGDEAMQRIERFNQIASQAISLKYGIPILLHDAYFQLVEYPLVCASLINKKFLYIEKAYRYALQGRASANDFAQMSIAAYDSISLYTNYYNNQLSNAKWKHMMNMSPRSLPVFDKPLLPQWNLPDSATWAIACEGDEEIRRVDEIKGPLNLPTFNNLTRQSYFVDLFLRSNENVEWVAEPTHDWIKVSCNKGLLEGHFGKKQTRVWISIDWEKVPQGQRFNGLVRFRGASQTRTVQINAVRQKINLAENEHLFIDDNRYISIFAENFNRISNNGGYEWQLLEGLGYTGNSVWVNPLNIKEKKYDPELENPSVLEYDFFLQRSGTVTIKVYGIPVHPVNKKFGVKFALSINNEKPQLIDFETHGRSETWKINVLSNTAEGAVQYQIKNAGLQTLKLFAIDPGVIIDRITIDAGGLIKSYSALTETKIEYVNN